MGPHCPHSSPTPSGALPARAQMAPNWCEHIPEKPSPDHPPGIGALQPLQAVPLRQKSSALPARPKEKPNKAAFKAEKVKVGSLKAIPHMPNTPGAAARVRLKFGEKTGK